jgi:hypothetical protein
MKYITFKLFISMLLIMLMSIDLAAQNTALTYKPLKDKKRQIWLGGHTGMTSSFGFSGKY